MSARLWLHERRWAITTALVYVGLAIASTWPLVARLGEVIPAGNEREATVPLASSWALWWTSDRLASGLSGFWDAPILHPEPGAFAFSEPMPLLGALASPVMWLGGSPALAHGLVLLLVLFLNGWLALGLLRRLGASELAAAFGGAMFVMLPYAHDQLGVLTLVPIFGALSTLRAVLAWFDEPGPRRGVYVGLALAITYYSCAQHALFLTLALVPACAVLVRRTLWTRPAAWGGLAAVAVAAITILPVALPQRAAVEHQGFARTEERARGGAASFKSYARSSEQQLGYAPPAWVAPPQNHRLFPGAYRLVLGVLGLVLLWRRQRRTARFLVVLGLAAMVLSLLPRLELGAASPWHWLRAAVPGLDQVRSMWRAGVLVQVVLTLGAGIAVGELISGWARRGERQRLRLAAVVALGVMSVVELWPRDTRMVPPPSLEAWRPFDAWVTEHLQPDDAMLYLPMAVGYDARAFEIEARYMYQATGHGRPIANGYSSYWPTSYNRLRASLARFPGADSLTAIEDSGVRALVIERHWLAARAVELPAPWQRAYENDAVVVFLRPRPVSAQQ